MNQAMSLASQAVSLGDKKYDWNDCRRFKLGTGTFGRVMKGKDTKTGKEVAVKLEEIKSNKTSSVKNEFYRYHELHARVKERTLGLPVVYDYFSTDMNHVLVMEVYGPDLGKLFKECGEIFSLKTVCQIGIQLIDRIEVVHQFGLYLHRDVKPQNFVIGRKEEPTRSQRNLIRIIDFGLSKDLVTEEGNKKYHIPWKTGKSLVGTARYVSIRTHDGEEHSRRDDLESIGYLLIHFLKGKTLPWIREEVGKTRQEIHGWIADKKKGTKIYDLCQGLPQEFTEFMKYVREDLLYHEKPDYDYLRHLLIQLFFEHKFTSDDKYDWDTEDASLQEVSSTSTTYTPVRGFSKSVVDSKDKSSLRQEYYTCM